MKFMQTQFRKGFKLFHNLNAEMSQTYLTSDDSYINDVSLASRNA